MKGKTSGPKMPSMPKLDGNVSMDIRKISNGYIVRTSGYQGKGKNEKYVNHEAFCPTKPSVNFGKSMSFGGRKK